MLTGQKITELRIKCNLTQSELAEKLFVTQPLVSLWEKGERRPDRESVKRLSEIFGVPQAELFEAEKSVFDELFDCIPENSTVLPEKLSEHLNVFVGTLSKQERIFFLRRYYFADGYNEIAEKYDTRDNTVRAVLSRVRKKLKKFLSEAVL